MRSHQEFDARSIARVILAFDSDAVESVHDEFGADGATMENLMEALNETVLSPNQADGVAAAPSSNVARGSRDDAGAEVPGDGIDLLVAERDECVETMARLQTQLRHTKDLVRYYRNMADELREERDERQVKDADAAYTGKRYLKARGEFELSRRRNLGQEPGVTVPLGRLVCFHLPMFLMRALQCPHFGGEGSLPQKGLDATAAASRTCLCPYAGSEVNRPFVAVTCSECGLYCKARIKKNRWP